MYVDPDGRFFFSAFIPFVGMYMDAACWGAVIGAASYTMNVATTPGGFDNWNWGQFGKSVGLNALSNVATAGVGDIFGGQGNFFKEFSRGLTHGAVGGGMSLLQGDKFLNGFASSSLSSWVGSGLSHTSVGRSVEGQVGFSMLAGGLGSLATSGSFINGAANGLMTSTFNHMQHNVDYKFAKRLLSHYMGRSGADYILTKNEFKYLIKNGKIESSGSLVNDDLYKSIINFYESGNSDLVNSFGKSTVYYRLENGRKGYVGFYDTYNFDYKPSGSRTHWNETKTRVASFIPGESFNIIYNIKR